MKSLSFSLSSVCVQIPFTAQARGEVTQTNTYLRCSAAGVSDIIIELLDADVDVCLREFAISSVSWAA